MSEHDKNAMTKFAGEALNGLLASGKYADKPHEEIAKEAFAIAQKMLDIYREIPRD